MTDQDVIDGLTDVEMAAVTAMGEARGDAREGGSSVEERIAVLWVMRNRLHLNPRHPASGATIKAVCLKPHQFSCWLPADPNRPALLAMARPLVRGAELTGIDPLLRETIYLAAGVAAGTILDRTHGATHYYSPASMTPAGAVPAWAQGQTPCARVGGEVFYKGV